MLRVTKQWIVQAPGQAYTLQPGAIVIVLGRFEPDGMVWIEIQQAAFQAEVTESDLAEHTEEEQ